MGLFSDSHEPSILNPEAQPPNAEAGGGFRGCSDCSRAEPRVSILVPTGYPIVEQTSPLKCEL